MYEIYQMKPVPQISCYRQSTTAQDQMSASKYISKHLVSFYAAKPSFHFYACFKIPNQDYENLEFLTMSNTS